MYNKSIMETIKINTTEGEVLEERKSIKYQKFPNASPGVVYGVKK
jgi:hypothetical protein